MNWRPIALLFIALVVVAGALATRLRFASNDEDGTLGAPAVFAAVSYEAAQDQAQTEGKLLVVDFMAEWCGPCKKMDKTTWVEHSVTDWVAKNAIAVQVDIDDRTDVASDHGITAVPTLVVFRNGQEVSRRTGLQSASGLLEWLDEIASAETDPGDTGGG